MEAFFIPCKRILDNEPDQTGFLRAQMFNRFGLYK